MSEGCRSIRRLLQCWGAIAGTGGEDFKVIRESLSQIEKGWENLRRPTGKIQLPLNRGWRTSHMSSPASGELSRKPED